MGIYEEQAIAEKLGLEKPVHHVKCECGGDLYGIKKVMKYGIECITPEDDYSKSDEIRCTKCDKVIKDTEGVE